MIYQGSCPCGAVRFEVHTSQEEIDDCACAQCNQSSQREKVAVNARFKQIEGEKVLSSFGFNSRIAQHYFCSVCGLKSFYLPCKKAREAALR